MTIPSGIRLYIASAIALVVSGCIHQSAPPPPPKPAPVLLNVEEEVAPYSNPGTLLDTNLLYRQNPSYAHCSSYRSGGFAQYILDGNVGRGWRLPDTETHGWVDASLGLPVMVDKIVVREIEDRIQAYELHVYDGSHWQLLAAGTTLGTKAFHLKPMPISGVRIDITTTGGGGIGEIEVYNTIDPATAFAGGPSMAVRQAFASERVALLLGSPLAFTSQGTVFINPREHAVRPLPDSGRYLPDVMRFLLQSTGGSAEWDEAKEVLQGTRNDKPIHLELSPQNVQTREQIVSAFVELGNQAGLACTVHPDTPGLLVFGDPLPETNEGEIRREVRNLLDHGMGVFQFSRDATNQAEVQAVISPSEKRIGTTMEWVGARTGSMDEGTNNAAWFSYIRPNAARTWYGYKALNRYAKVPGPDDKIETIDDFERVKADVRQAPEDSSWILWQKLLASDQHKALQHEYALYKKFDVDVVNATGAKIWPNEWSENFRYWLVTYMATYYLAKYYDVTVHQYGNEPDWYLQKLSDEEIALKLQLQADAITSAIEDVNRLHGKKLDPKYAAPVLASDPRSRIARIMMQNLRTDYRGRTLDRDLVQFYNRHRYSDRARQNVLEVNQVQDMMLEESVTGKPLPQIFTELNYATGRNWARPHMTVTNDSPEVIHTMASIWGQMMATQHVYGVFLFKLNASSNRWSNTVIQQFFRESDSGPARLNPDWKPGTEVGYASKNAEILRLFAEGFAGSQDLLETNIGCGDMHYQAYTTYNADRDTYYLWTVQVNEQADYTVELDLSDLDVKAGAPVSIREISAAKFGEVVYNGRLPDSRKITVTQPRASAWLVSVPKNRKVTVRNYPAVADATVKQGTSSKENAGSSPVLQVRRHSNSDMNRISYLKFIVDGEQQDIERAYLRLHGKRVSEYAFDNPFTFRVYGLADDSWQELQLTADNAPAICRTVSATKRGAITLSSPPVGHLSFTDRGVFSEIDVTNFVREHADKELTFLLIRELKWPGEDTDFAGAELASREAGAALAPNLQILY